MDWVVKQHGFLYTTEFGWDASFETLVAGIASEFVKNFDPAHERCWIAEIDGAIVGPVFLVMTSDDVAKLRLLIVS